jgi:hypothetical protein
MVSRRRYRNHLFNDVPTVDHLPRCYSDWPIGLPIQHQKVTLPTLGACSGFPDIQLFTRRGIDMKHRDIAEVRARLEKAVATESVEPLLTAEVWQRTEEIAIQILDSEHDWYPDGQLSELLMSYLYIRQIELGLLPFPAPEEE